MFKPVGFETRVKSEVETILESNKPEVFENVVKNLENWTYVDTFLTLTELYSFSEIFGYAKAIFHIKGLLAKLLLTDVPISDSIITYLLTIAGYMALVFSGYLIYSLLEEFIVVSKWVSIQNWLINIKN